MTPNLTHVTHRVQPSFSLICERACEPLTHVSSRRRQQEIARRWNEACSNMFGTVCLDAGTYDTTHVCGGVVRESEPRVWEPKLSQYATAFVRQSGEWIDWWDLLCVFFLLFALLGASFEGVCLFLPFSLACEVM